MPTNFVFGTAAELAMDPSGPGGTSFTVILDCVMNDITLERELDEAETTTLCSTIKDYIPGLSETTLEFEGLYDSSSGGADEQLDATFGEVVSWRYRPAGTGSGLPQYTFNGFLQDYQIEATVDEAVTIEGTVRLTGGFTRSVQS